MEITTIAQATGALWETLISDFISEDHARNRRLWRLADISLEVRQSFGDEALPKFAGDVRYSGDTLRRYSHTAAVFPADWRSERADLLDFLSFTHFRVAACLTSCAQEAEAAVYHAADEDWSTRQLQEFIVHGGTVRATGTLQLHIVNSVPALYLDGEPLVGRLERLVDGPVELVVRRIFPFPED